MTHESCIWGCRLRHQLTHVAEAQHVEQRVHVRLGGEVDAGAHVAEGRVDVLRAEHMQANDGSGAEQVGWQK